MRRQECRIAVTHPHVNNPNTGRALAYTQPVHFAVGCHAVADVRGADYQVILFDFGYFAADIDHCFTLEYIPEFIAFMLVRSEGLFWRQQAIGDVF